ncbi:hypothetical protein RRG08_029596 [Elysia crispata]|uniref:RGS domain-containing protein n=1 Tax=Elysia crispata TaxID=231223 RepID=A0AAE0XP62_9GAST|nr:hypothetical protein RRG08_029596 [Elysia crispata]
MPWHFVLCLAVKSSNGGGDKSRDNKLGAVTEKEEPPTLEELRMWGESFDKLMKCAGGRKIFREFLRSEYSEENMLFYLACEDLKKERIPELIEEKARLIYEDYISILSPKEVTEKPEMARRIDFCVGRVILNDFYVIDSLKH